MTEREDALHRHPDLAHQVVRLLDSPDLAVRLAAAGRDKARREYDWSIISRRLLRLYESIVARAHR